MGKYEVRVYYGRLHLEVIEADSIEEALENERNIAIDEQYSSEEEIDDLEVIDLNHE